jgi:5-methylthioadenosine/S-adenosylhomocysteine deaminase
MESSQPESVDFLIVGPDLVTMDGARSTIRGGTIAIRDGRIAWLGPSAEAEGRFITTERLHAPGRIALPGLIDAHFHTGQQLLRGKLVELAKRRHLRIPIWRNYLIPFESILDEDDVHLSALLAYSNMLRVGTTCFAEAGGPHPDQMGRAAEEVGIRGFIALSTLDTGEGIPETMRMTTRQAIDRNVELVERWNAPSRSDRVQAWLALRQLIVCSEELWTTFRDLSAELDARVHIHLAEGTYEVDYATERWGQRPAEYLDHIGFLGRRVLAAHSILLSQRELELYEKHRVAAAHCPQGNYLIGPPKIPQMWELGIPIGIGSDGASTGSIDLFQAVHISWVAQQSYFGTPWHDRSVFTPEDLLALATSEGAEAVGCTEELGSLEAGKRADVLLVNPQELDLQPVYDPVFTASRCVHGRDVETVIVDGKVVMKDRRLLTIDEEQLRARIDERWPRIMERFEEAVT